MKNHISFPGLGIKEFTIDPVAIKDFLGLGINIAWYGIIISFGILLSVLYVLYRAKHDEGIKQDDVFDFAIWAIPLGVIGARIYYVIMQLEEYKGKPFIEYIAIWKGGIAIYGAIIGGALGLFIASRIKKIKLGKAFDMVAPGVMIAQAVGRWGNFCNGEAYGRSENVATFPLRMHLRKTEISYGTEDEIFSGFVHPTFLYESIWNLIGFILINFFYKKKKYDGQIFLMYITWYGFGRMLIEGLRTDSLRVGNFRISQVIGFLCFFFGAAFLTAMLIVTKLRERDRAAAAAGTVNESDITPADPFIPESPEEKKDDGIFEISDTYSDDDEE